MKTPSPAVCGCQTLDPTSLAQDAFTSVMIELGSCGAAKASISTAYPSRTIDLIAAACVLYFAMQNSARHGREDYVTALVDAVMSIKAGHPTVLGDELAALVFDGLITPDYMNAWGDLSSR